MKKIAFPLAIVALGFLMTGPASAQVVMEEPTIITDTLPVDSTDVEVITVRKIDVADLYSGTDEEYITEGRNKRFGFNPFRQSRSNSKRWKWSGGHWAGVGIYYNGLIQNMGHLSLPDHAEYLEQSPGSIGVSINFVDFVIISDRSFGLITGLGLESNNFKFDRNLTLMRDAAGYIVPDFSYEAAGIKLKKSKLTTTYLNIPLLVEFQFGGRNTNWRRRGFINFGVVAGILVNGHTKVKYTNLGDMSGTGTDNRTGRFVDKRKDGLNLRNFHYGAELNVGYRSIALSAKYYPQSIFKSDKGPNVQQVNIGLAWLF